MDALETLNPSRSQFLQTGMAAVGLGNPAMRAVTVAALVQLVQMYIKPSYAYDGSGSARSWLFLDPKHGGTYIPAWMISILMGLSAGIFL